MAKLYRIDTQKKILYITHKGVINEDNCAKCIKQVCSDPDFDRNLAKLIDLTEAESSSKLDVNKVHENMMEYQCGPKSKMAIVARHPMTVAKAMLMLELRDDRLKESKSKVFSELENAEFWLQN